MHTDPSSRVRHTPALTLLLASLASLGPFSIDTYLPAFPQMGAALAASPWQVQQTLSAYMLTFAFMALWHGALADSFGRRRVILIATLLFGLASALCALAPAIEWLWLGRALQGLSAGAGMVVGRALVRDLYDGAQAQRMTAHIMMCFALAPAVAPMAGAALLTVFAWPSVFWLLALLGVGLGLWCWRSLPETLPVGARQPFSPRALYQGYREVFGHSGFWLLVLSVAFSFNGFFVHVLSAPAVVYGHLGLSGAGFIWLFGPAVAGMIGGSALSARLAGRMSLLRSAVIGVSVMLLAVFAHAALFVGELVPPPWRLLALALYTFGMALAMPAMTVLTLDDFPLRRGMAASCQSFLQVGLNALVAGLVAPLVWVSPGRLALAMSACWLVSALLLGLWWWRNRRTQRPVETIPGL